MNLTSIPQELKDKALFCVWKYEQREDGGKPTKVPYNARTGGKAQCDNPNTFYAFDVAYSAYQGGGYDGLGIGVFPPFAALDLDHCYTDGVMSDMAVDIINHMGSYTEVSPSGKGVRIIFTVDSGFVYDKNAYYINNQSVGLECYISACTKKYVTITGNALNENAITNGTEFLPYVLDKYMKRVRVANPPSPALAMLTATSYMTDSEYLKIGFEKDPNLPHYWRGGFPTTDESQNDSKLIYRLLYWLNGDTQAAVNTFLSSPYVASKDPAHREKLQREDYLERTTNEMLRLLNGRTAAGDNAIFWANQESRIAGESDMSDIPFVWGQPKRFSDYNLPSFPIHCLPENIREYVEAVAENLQVSIDMSATAALAVLALCVAKKYIVDCNGKGWKEPLNLFCVIIALPSERKSPMLRKMTDIVYDYVKRENLANAAVIEQSRIEKAILENKRTSLIKAQGKAKHPSSTSSEDIQDISQKITQFEEIKPMRLIADDVSTERLNGLLYENNGRMAIISAEGGIFDTIGGRYTANGAISIDTFLKGYSGDAIQVDRIGRSGEDIKSPALTVLLAIQPEVLSGLVSNAAFRGRGLPARFLYSFPKSKVGERNIDPPAIPEFARHKYEAAIETLLRLPMNDTPLIIPLCDEALEVSLGFNAWLEPQLKDGLRDISDFAGKLHGNILRIAGLLHIAESIVTGGYNEPIGAGTVASAVEIGKYYLAHAQASYDLMGSSSELENAKYLLSRLRGFESKLKPGERLTKRYLLKVSKFKTVGEIEPPLAILCDYGYIRELPLPEREKDEYGRYKAGQNPSPEYEINPSFT